MLEGTSCIFSGTVLACLGLLGDCAIVLLFSFVELLIHSLSVGLGVNLPEDLEQCSGEDLGDMFHGAWFEGESVQLLLGGEFPQADDELPELVLLL